MSDPDERLQELCDLASKERDPEKLMQFAAELNELLEAKEHKLQERRKNHPVQD